MIAGNGRHLEAYKSQLPPAVYEAIEAIRKEDFLQMEDGSYELSDVGILKVKSPMTAAAKDRPLRAHRHVIDVVYLIHGEEWIGWAPASKEASIVEDRTDKDQYTVENLVGESRIHMKAGSFAVFFPGEFHRPDLEAGAPAVVRKAVLKIRN